MICHSSVETLKSALHNVDVCGCVFMHGKKVNFVVCPFVLWFLFLSDFFVCVSETVTDANFFAQLTKGEEQSWVLAGRQHIFKGVQTISSEVSAREPLVCRWHQTQLSVQSNKSIVTVLVMNSHYV